MVVPEAVFVDVRLQPLAGHAVVNAVQPALEGRPEALDCLDVNHTAGVLVVGVVNPLMLVEARHGAVDVPAVRVERRSGLDVLHETGPNVPGSTKRNHLSTDTAVTFDHAENDGLTSKVLLAGPLGIGAGLPTDERLVGFHDAAQR